MAPIVGRLSVVVVTGHVAAGKSTVARALAERFDRAAVIDVDLVYEMLAGPGRKDDAETWAAARRVTARLVDSLLEERCELVVVDGDAPVTGLRVVLRASFEAACARVDADPSRTFSRDRDFLARHYAEETFSGDLVLDTERSTVEETVDAIVAAL